MTVRLWVGALILVSCGTPEESPRAVTSAGGTTASSPVASESDVPSSSPDASSSSTPAESASATGGTTSSDGGGAGGREAEGPVSDPTMGGAGQGGAAPVPSVGGGSGGIASGGSATATAGSSNEGNDAGEHEFSIVFDYRFDLSGWFDAAERRVALEAAAEQWSAHIQDDFEEIPAGTPLRVRNLDQVDDTFLEFTLDEAIDDIVIFVACTNALPEGVAGRTRRAMVAPGEFGREFQQRLIDRWSGADQEPWALGIAFACEADFFFDTTPETADDIPAFTVDFISLAAHEIGHALGIGGSDTFTALVNEEGASFNGEEAVLVYGVPVPLVENGGLHFDGVRVDGLPVLMGQDHPASERYYPARLELAVLADLGYEIATAE